MITSIATFIQQAEQPQAYWFAFDWLVLFAVVALSVATTWAIYRYWLAGWVNHFRPPFHLRLFAVIVGLGMFLIIIGSYALEYKLHEWEIQTFLIFLGIAIAFWSLLLLIEFIQGKRVRF